MSTRMDLLFNWNWIAWLLGVFFVVVIGGIHSDIKISAMNNVRFAFSCIHIEWNIKYENWLLWSGFWYMVSCKKMTIYKKKYKKQFFPKESQFGYTYLNCHKSFVSVNQIIWKYYTKRYTFQTYSNSITFHATKDCHVNSSAYWNLST